MKLRPTIFLAFAVLSIAVAADSDKDKNKDKPKSDILAPDKRRASVDLALLLTRPPEPAPLPADLAQPFNPSGFDLPDREERPPAVANQTTRGGDAGGGNTAAAAPIPGDRELLETLAAKLPSTGYFNFRGEDILTLGGTNRVKIGGRFTVQHNGQPYELELTAINSNNFTLRYRSQEITRPIKSGK